MKNESVVVIDRPVAEVFAFTTDFDKLPQWLQGLKRKELISGEPGRVGNRNRQFVEEMGYELEVLEEVTGYQENEEFSNVVTHPEFEARATFRFSDLGGGKTQVQLNTETTLKSWKFKMMSPMISSQVQKRQDESLQRLKENLEKA